MSGSSPIQPHFGHELRRLRKERLGLTQQQFAEVLGVDDKQPSRWENLQVAPKGWKVYCQLMVQRWPDHASFVPGPDLWEKNPRVKSVALAPSLDHYWPANLGPEWNPVQAVRQVASWIGVAETDIWARPYEFAVTAAQWMNGENDIYRRQQFYLAAVEAEYYARCQGLRFLSRCVDLALLRPTVRSAYEAAANHRELLTFGELEAVIGDLLPLNASEELAVCFMCKEVAAFVVAQFGELIANDAVQQNDFIRSQEVWLFAKSQRRVRKLRRRLSHFLSHPCVDHHEALARSLNVLSEVPTGWRSLSISGIANLPSFLAARQARPKIPTQ